MSVFVTLKTLIRSLGFVGILYQLPMLFWLGGVIFGGARIPPTSLGVTWLWLGIASFIYGERWRVVLSNRRATLLPGMRRHAFPAILMLVALQILLVVGVPVMFSPAFTPVFASPLLITCLIALTGISLGLAAGLISRLLNSLMVMAILAVIHFRPLWLFDSTLPIAALLLPLAASLYGTWYLVGHLLDDRQSIRPSKLVSSVMLGPGLAGKELLLLGAALVAASLALFSGRLDEGQARDLALVAWTAPLCVILPLLWRHRLNRPQWRRLSLLPGWSKRRLGQRLNRGLVQSVSLVVFGQWLVALASLPGGLAEPSRVFLALLIAPAIAWLAVETILRLALVDDKELGGVLYLGVFIAIGSLVLSSGSVVFFGIGLYPLGGLAGIGLLSLAGALMLRAGRQQAWHQAEF